MDGEIPLWFFKELCVLAGGSVRHEEFIDFKNRFVRSFLENNISLAPVSPTA